MIDPTVLEALREAIRHENPIRLVTSGKRPENKGLFPRRTGPYAKAIAFCLDKEHGFLNVSREDRKGKTVSVFVTINERGLEALTAHVPVEEYARLFEESAAPFRAKLREKCLAAVRRRGEQLDAQRRQLLETRQRELAAALELVKACKEQLDAEKKQLDAQTAHLIELRGLLEKGSAAAEPPVHAETPGKTQQSRPEPRSEEDLNFQRDISEELVYAWRDAVNQDTREALARALFNAGVEPIGEPGQRIDFDGTWQHPEDELNPDDLVEIVQPGWRLVNQYGPYVILRARVRKARQPEREPACPQ